MVLRPDLLRLQKDLLARLRELASGQALVSAQDLRMGSFTPAYAVSLLPRLVGAGLLEEQASGGMRGRVVYRFHNTVGPGATAAITEYLTTLSARGFKYVQPTKAAPLDIHAIHARRGLAEVVD